MPDCWSCYGNMFVNSVAGVTDRRVAAHHVAVVVPGAKG